MADDKSGNVVQSTIIRVDHLCCQGEAALVRKLLEPFEACLQNANTRGRSTQDPSVAARNERSRANGSYQRPSRMDANSPFSCHRVTLPSSSDTPSPKMSVRALGDGMAAMRCRATSRDRASRDGRIGVRGRRVKRDSRERGFAHGSGRHSRPTRSWWADRTEAA